MGKKKGGQNPGAPGGSGPPPGQGQQQGGYGPPPGQDQQQGGFGPSPGQGQQHRGYGPPPGQSQHHRGYGPPPGQDQQQGGFGPSPGQGQQYRGYGPPPGQSQHHRGYGPPPGQDQQQGGFGPSPGQGQQHRGYGPPPGQSQHHRGYGPPPGQDQQQGGFGPSPGQGQQHRGYGPPPGQSQHHRGYGPPPGQGHQHRGSSPRPGQGQQHSGTSPRQQQGGYVPPPSRMQQHGRPGGFGPHQGRRPSQEQPSGFTPHQVQQREEGGPARFGPPPGQRQQPGGPGGYGPRQSQRPQGQQPEGGGSAQFGPPPCQWQQPSGPGGLPPHVAPVWGKQPDLPSQETPVQPEFLIQPAEIRRGRRRGPAVEQQPPTPAPAAAPRAAVPFAQEKAQPTPAEGKPGGKKQKGEAKETQKTQTAATPTPTPSTSEVGDMTEKTKDLTLHFNLPKRKDHEIVHTNSHVQKKFLIEVNYLPLKIKNTKLRIYHYDVDFKPDTPKYLLRNALKEMQKIYFGHRHPAFDGKKNMYAAGTPLFKDEKPISHSVTVYNHEKDQNKEFHITITIKNDNLTIAKLLKYCKEGVTSKIPQMEIQATDIALRSGLTDFFTAAGRSFFAKDDYPVPLGGGFELWHGFYQSAIPAWKPYLNIDVANKAFPIEQSVMSFLCKASGYPEEDYVDYALNDQEKCDLKEFITGLKISYNMPSQSGFQKRIYKVIGLGGTPIVERFKPNDDDPEISVGDYYQRDKNYIIKYRKLPLLKIGNEKRMVPLELCSIIGNQAVFRDLDSSQTSAMVKNAARPTSERKKRIMTSIQNAKFNQNSTLKEFGIEVTEKFEDVEAVVIRPPKLSYAGPTEKEVRNGVWNINNDRFKVPSQFPDWAVLNLNHKVYSQKIKELVELMIKVGQELGMSIPPPKKSQVHRGDLDEEIMDNYLITSGAKLVIVILSDAKDIYGKVKRASEFRTGVLTQCIKDKTVFKINEMTVRNILLKVNSKLKGVNHSLAPSTKPPILNVPCMFVGADVTHPSPGNESIPSIAAVAASHDQYGFQYKMLYRLQKPKEEMILDLANIMKDQLESFIKTNNVKPHKILYYRDGVSEGQFQKVLNVELVAIRRACKMISPDYEPAITFLVVQKRHHTRFFPDPRDGDRRNCNVPAGTLVDKRITHPTEVDFYLVSHQSIQGTARPTKYHLLWDDSDLDQIELEKLTYYLCHMFARCTRSVSYPAPTYYAHLAAFRARNWWIRYNPKMDELQQDQETRGTISANILDNYPMFFT